MHAVRSHPTNEHALITYYNYDFLSTIDGLSSEKNIYEFVKMQYSNRFSGPLLFLLLTTQLVLGLPNSQSTILKRSEEVKDAYDYVIIGGGTAGLTVGDRLTEDGKCKSPSHNPRSYPPQKFQTDNLPTQIPC